MSVHRSEEFFAHHRNMLIDDATKELLMEAVDAKRALLTENEGIKHSAIEAMRDQDVDKLRDLFIQCFGMFDLNSWICLMDEDCSVLDFYHDDSPDPYDKIKLLCYAFENVSTPEDCELCKLLVDVFTDFGFDTAGTLFFRWGKDDTLSFWFSLMRKIKIAKTSNKTKKEICYYRDFEEFVYDLMEEKHAAIVRLSIGLLFGSDEKASAIARQYERQKLFTDSDSLYLWGPNPFPESAEINDVWTFELHWLALMKGNVDVLECLERSGRGIQFCRNEEGNDYLRGVGLLYRFYHHHFQGDLCERVEAKGLLDPTNSSVKMAKLFLAVDKGDAATFKSLLAGFNESERGYLTAQKLPFRCRIRGYDNASLCQDIKAEDSSFDAKDIYTVTLESENVQVLKVLIDQGFLPYSPSRALFSTSVSFGKLLHVAFMFYTYTKKNQAIFDAVFKGPLRKYVSPLVLFYAAHELDLKFIRELRRQCGEGILQDKVEDGFTAHGMATKYSTCPDTDTVLVLLKGELTATSSVAKKARIKLDSKSLVELSDKELLERLDEERDKEEESLLVTAVKAGVDFDRFLLIKEKLQERNPGEINDFDSMFRLVSTAIKRENPSPFLERLLSDEEIVGTKMRLDGENGSYFFASLIDLFLEATTRDSENLSNCVKPFLNTFADSFVFEITLDRLRRIAENHFQVEEGCVTFYHEMLKKLLRWCQGNRDGWMAALSNWMGGERAQTIALTKSLPDEFLKQIKQTRWSICEYIQDHDVELFKSQNRLGMNLLMHFADSEEIDVVLFKTLHKTGLYDVNAVTAIKDLATKFDLQHLAGSSVSAKKQKNTVLVGNELVRGKRVVVKNKETGEYEKTKSSYPGQEKYISKDVVSIKDTTDVAARHIMVTARKPRRGANSKPRIASRVVNNNLTAVEEEAQDVNNEDIGMDAALSDIEPDDAINFNDDTSIASHRGEREAPEGLEDTASMTINEKINKMQIKTYSGIVPEHFDSQSVKTDKESSGFRTKKNKYKFAADTSTKGFITDSNISDLLSPNFCEGTNVLLLSIKAKHKEKVKYLLTNTKVDVFHKDVDQCSPLSLIIKKFPEEDCSELVQLVLKKLNKKTMKKDKDADGKTARQIADELNKQDIVNLLDNFNFVEEIEMSGGGEINLDGFRFKKKGEKNKNLEQRWMCTGAKCSVSVRTKELEGRKMKLLGTHKLGLHKHTD